MVFSKMLMQYDFHFDLLGGKAAGAECMFLVDELDGNDWFRGIEGNSFADAVAKLAAGIDCTSERTDEAYAPCPMVLLTSRKGRFVGRGATWLPGGAGPMVAEASRVQVEANSARMATM